MHLHETNRNVKKAIDDPAVVMAKRFLSLFVKCQTEYDFECLSLKMPGIFYAHRIWKAENCKDKAIIEARILSGQSPEVIAERASTSPEVIRWFEKLFFDVRGRLHHRDWVINRVLGPTIHTKLYENEFELLIKLYALIGGPLVVDSLVEMSSRSVAHPTDRERLAVFWREDGSDTLKRKAAIAVRCMPINTQTMQTILEGYHKMVELEKADNVANNTGELLLKTISDALTAVPFRVVEEMAVDVLASNAAKHGAELRVAEMLQRVHQPDLKIDDADYVFPEIEHGT